MFLLRKILFLSLFLIGLGIQQAFSQEGKPTIENFPPSSFQSEEYDSSPQILSIIQDNTKITYFANASGILEYDGIKWRMVDSTAGITFRAFEKDETGRIYCGGNNKMGYLKSDLTGKMLFYSLPIIDTSDFIIRKIICIKSVVYFLSDEHLYKWTGKEFKKLVNWRFRSRIIMLNDELYAENIETGLYKLINDSLIQLPGYNSFKGLIVNDLFKINNDLTKTDTILVITQNQGLFEFTGTGLRKVNNEIEKVLKNKDIFNTSELKDGNIALGTYNNGIIIIDKYLNTVKIIDESSGLYDNSILSLYEDNSGSLWAGLQKGISRINYPENLSCFDKSKGVDGMVNCISNIAGKLYIGTNHGLYKYENNEKSGYGFNRIAKFNDEIWKIINYNNDLFVATNKGIYKISNENFELISPGLRETYTLYKSKKFPDRLFIGSSNGLSSILYKTRKWIDEGKIEGINHEVRSIVEADDGKLWVSYEDISRVDFSKGFSNHPLVEKIEMKKGLDKNPSVYEVTGINNKVLIATDVGLFHYNENLKILEPDNTLGERFAKEKHEASTLTQDKNGNIWLTSDFKNGVLIHNPDNSYTFDTIALLKMPKTQVWSIYPDETGIVWFGTTEGLFRYDSKVAIPYNMPFNTLIRKVKVTVDSTIF